MDNNLAFFQKVSKIFTFSKPKSVLNTHYLCNFGDFGKIFVM